MPSKLDYSFRTLLQEQIPDNILDKARDFISEKLSPEDVFSNQQLTRWAVTNFSVSELDDGDIKDYIKSTFHPEEVFEKDELESWAESHGFVVKE